MVIEMKEKVEYIIDDSPVVMPDYIKEMSDEEIDVEIERLEKKGRMERERIQNEKELITI